MSKIIKITSSEWMRDVERMAEQEHDPRNYIGVEVLLAYLDYKFRNHPRGKT